MTVDATLLRAFLGAVLLVAYVVGLLFSMWKADLKHFTVGFWIGAALTILLAPVILAYVATVV